MDDARHFFPFLPVAFGLGIAIYFVWPSEPGFYYLVWSAEREESGCVAPDPSCRWVASRFRMHILGEAYQLAWRTPSGDMAVMHEKRAGYDRYLASHTTDADEVNVALNCNLAQNWLW